MTIVQKRIHNLADEATEIGSGDYAVIDNTGFSSAKKIQVPNMRMNFLINTFKYPDEPNPENWLQDVLDINIPDGTYLSADIDLTAYGVPITAKAAILWSEVFMQFNGTTQPLIQLSLHPGDLRLSGYKFRIEHTWSGNPLSWYLQHTIIIPLYQGYFSYEAETVFDLTASSYWQLKLFGWF